MKNLIVTRFLSAVQLKNIKGKTLYQDSRFSTGIIGILKGKIMFIFKDKKIICEKNEAMFIPEGTEYTIEYLEDTHSLVFNFRINEISETIKKISDVNLYSSFKIIHTHFALSKEVKVHPILSELYKILAEFSYERKMNKHSKMIEYAAKTINDNFSNPDFLCKDISKNLNISEAYLRMIFKEEYGISPLQYLLKTRMNEAAYLLMENLSVTDTAQMVGYKDIFQFSKAYKKYFGYPPKSTIFYGIS